MNERLEKLCTEAKSLTGIDIRYAKGRKEEYVRIRFAISNIGIKYMGFNTVQMADFFNYDHSTIVHHKKSHKGKYQSDDEYAHLFDQLIKRIGADNESKLDTDEIISLIKELQ